MRLVAVIDLHSRQVVGWSMASHMQTSLVADALRMAWFRRQSTPLERFCVILADTLPVVIHHAEIELRRRKSLRCCQSIPLERFCVILADTLPVVIHHAEIEL